MLKPPQHLSATAVADKYVQINTSRLIRLVNFNFLFLNKILPSFIFFKQHLLNYKAEI